MCENCVLGKTRHCVESIRLRYTLKGRFSENKGFSLSTTDDRIVFRFEGKILMTSYKKNRIISIWRVCGSNYSVVF